MDLVDESAHVSSITCLYNRDAHTLIRCVVYHNYAISHFLLNFDCPSFLSLLHVGKKSGHGHILSGGGEVEL